MSISMYQEGGDAEEGLRDSERENYAGAYSQNFNKVLVGSAS
jgi:hypothetical protein